MTSTKVTQAAGMFLDALGAGAAGSVNDIVDGGFSQVMDQTRQDMGDGRLESRQEALAAVKTPVKVERGIKENSEQQKKSASVTEQEAVNAHTSQTETKEAKEVLEEAAAELEKVIKEELDLTDEELESIMETLGLSQMDLLRQENVQAIVMAAAGENDQMSILTDEGLYQSLQKLTAAVKEVTAKVQTQLEVDAEAFEGILDQMEVATAPQQPEQSLLKEEAGPVVILEEKPETPENVTDEDTETPVRAEETPKADGVEQSKEQIQKSAITNEQPLGEEAKRENSSSEKRNETGKEAHGEHSSQLMQTAAKPGTAVWSQELIQDGMEFPVSQTDVEDIMRQVTDYVKIEAGTELTEMEMQLQPETLGTLRIHLTTKEGVVTAQFTAETEAVKAVLEAQTMQLKENLNNQGVKVEAVEVTVANQGFERSFAENGDGAAGYEEPKKREARKIQLTEELTLEEMELSEEDRITAEMMEMNGNTVDYTA